MATHGKEKNGSHLEPMAHVRAPMATEHDPFRTLEAFRNMMDSFWATSVVPEITEFQPSVNLYEADGSYTLECAVPGYKKENIAIEARGDHVLISGSYAETKTGGTDHYHRRELRHGSFTRTVMLPREIDPNRVSAKLENGLLTVKLQPAENVGGKRIAIED